MNKAITWIIFAAALLLTACSNSQKAKPELANSLSICQKSNKSVTYKPLEQSGYSFSSGSVKIFKTNVDGVVFASAPQALDFPIAGSFVQFIYSYDSNDELELAVCLEYSSNDARVYAKTGRIGSAGGEVPVVADILLEDVDEDQMDELILLVKWRAENALGTHGYIYEPLIFNAPNADGVLSRLEFSDEGLRAGFDGVREEEEVIYPYKEENSLRAKLRELGN